jgi:hypothetical protein
MSPRKPNMLEAFQASASAEQDARAASGPAAAPPPAEGAGGPLAEGAPAPPAHAAEALMGRRRPARSARPLLTVLAVLLGMAILFAAGRALSGRTRAAEPTTDGGSELEVPGAPTQVPVEPETAPAPQEQELTADDLAFLSRENRFSVRAIQFDDDERGRRLAYESYRYLRDKGLPAVTPLTQGEVLVICVGAEPEQNPALRDLRSRLHALEGPPPQRQPGAFDSAYIVNISDQISDEWRR